MIKSADYVEGLRAAHAILMKRHTCIAFTHRHLAFGFLGRPTRRHHELMAIADELAQAASEVAVESACPPNQGTSGHRPVSKPHKPFRKS